MQQADQLTLHDDDSPISPRRVRAWLILIVLAALAIRGFNVLARSDTIDSDTASFLYQAKSLVHGDVYQWFAIHHKPPIYSGLIAVGWKLGLDPINSGRVVAVLFGLLVLHPTWLLLRRSGPVGAGLVGLAILALMKEPVQTSGRCISDTTYAAIMMYALYFLVVPGLADGRWWAFAAAGAFGGLAFLTRTEGLMLLPIGLGLLVVAAVRRKLPVRTALLGGLLMCVACLVFVGPYVGMVSAAEGRLTFRRNMGQFMLYSAGATKEAIPSAGKGPNAVEALGSHMGGMAVNWVKNFVKYVTSYVARCGGYVTGLFLLTGLIAIGRRLWRWRPCQLGLGVFVLSLCVLSLVRPHVRMLLATIPLTGMLMGVGVLWIHQQVDKLNLPGKHKPWAHLVVPGIAVAAVTAVSVAGVVRYDPYKETGLRNAAAVVSAHCQPGEFGPSGPRIVSSEPAVAWFADGELVTFSEKWSLTMDKLHAFLRENKADFLVLDDSELAGAGLSADVAKHPPAFLKYIGDAASDPRSEEKQHLFVFRVVTRSP